MKDKIKSFFTATSIFLPLVIVLIMCGIFISVGTLDEKGRITLTGETTQTPEGFEELIKEAQIQLAKSAKSTLIELDGEKVYSDKYDTVDIIDAPKVDDMNTDEMEIGGQGANWGIDTTSPTTVKNTMIGRCIDVDGSHGAQCFDEFNAFLNQTTGRWANSCGTGAARGLTDCWQKNARNDFEMIWNANNVRAGDWVVFSGGTYGHVGMALGSNNNGYVALLGQNQGGAACPGGGAAGNIINKSLGDFRGAFRWKGWKTPEPTPTPSPSPSPAPTTTSYTVRKGDTLGQILKNLGWCGGSEPLFGDNGCAQRYATKNGIMNRGLIYPGQTINK